MTRDPAADEEALARIRELREAGGSWKNIRRSLGIGNSRFDRLRTRLGKFDLARDRRFSLDKQTPRPPDPPPMKTTLTITLTAAAAKRLEAIAESVYLPTDAFVQALLAGYLAREPLDISLVPRDPDEDDSAADDTPEEPEENPEEGPEGVPMEEPEEVKPADDEPEVFEFHESDFDWLAPGKEFVVRHHDEQVSVRCVAIFTYDPKRGRVVAPDRRVHDAGDAIRCAATDGAFDGELDFYAEDVVFEE